MLSRIRLFVAVGVLCGLASFLPAQSSNRAVWPLPETYFPGLKTLLDSAVRQSPRMIARNTEEAVAEAERIAARAGQLPSVRGYGNFYPWIQDKRGPETTTTAKTSYNFSAEQPVFHWGALHNTTRIGELRKKIVQGQTAEVYRGLVAEIRGVYLQLVMKRLSLQRARAAQQMADEALGLARKRFEQKVVSEADLFGPTIAAEQARLAADRLEEDLNNSLVFVGKLCGVPAPSMAELPTAIPAITPASEALDGVVAEFSGQPEPATNGLGVLRRQIEIEKLNYRIADARLRPKMNAVFGLYQDEQNYLVQEGGVEKYRYEQVQSLFAGLTVNWSIFDGFATKAAKTASLVRRRQLERDYGSQVENVIANVRGQRRQLDFALRGLAISEQYLALGGRTLQTREDEQRRGLISTADLSAARLQYLDAQVATFAARNDYLLKVAELLSATQNDPALAGLPEHLR
jgi:outer membrane protein TolC